MIGEKIQKYRKDKGFTLSELAAKAEISKSYLSNIERGIKKNPSIQVIARISNVLEVETKELIMSSNVRNHESVECEVIINRFKNVDLSEEQMNEYIRILDYVIWRQQQDRY